MFIDESRRESLKRSNEKQNELSEYLHSGNKDNNTLSNKKDKQTDSVNIEDEDITYRNGIDWSQF